MECNLKALKGLGLQRSFGAPENKGLLYDSEKRLYYKPSLTVAPSEKKGMQLTEDGEMGQRRVLVRPLSAIHVGKEHYNKRRPGSASSNVYVFKHFNPSFVHD